MSNEPTIDQRIIEKRNKLIEIHGVLSIYLAQELSFKQKAKATELQDRLEFRVKQYEEKLLDEKIDIYQQVLKIVKHGA